MTLMSPMKMTTTMPQVSWKMERVGRRSSSIGCGVDVAERIVAQAWQGKAASVFTLMHRRTSLPKISKGNYCKLGEKRGMLMRRETTTLKGKEHDVLWPR